MIHNLCVKNIILMEDVSVELSSGLTVFSGETGAGKSALLLALRLILGERIGKESPLRHGCESATIEANFSPSTRLLQILEDAGIEADPQEAILVRRDLYATGKGRIRINHQQAQLSLLQSIGAYLVDIVAQHAGHELLQEESHRDALDSFAGLWPLREKASGLWSDVQRLNKRFCELETTKEHRDREELAIEKSLEELAKVNILEGEEEALHEELGRLTHSCDLRQGVEDIERDLFDGEYPILSRLKQEKQRFERLSGIDSALKVSKEHLSNAIAELEELSYTLQTYISSLDVDPQRLDFVNSRLGQVHGLTKTYGDISKAQEKLSARHEELIKLQDEQVSLQKKIEESKRQYDEYSELLSRQRMLAAKTFGSAVQKHLPCLNMESATFQVLVEPAKEGPTGKDRVSFTFSPNPGEGALSLRLAASGGELARILLVIKTVLAGRGDVKTLIFDEIDSGIGGETATYVGKMLQQLAEHYQVLCITHSPQIASHAHHHYRVVKQEKEGRTISSLEYLEGRAREKEFTRMLGGQRFHAATKDLAEKIVVQE